MHKVYGSMLLAVTGLIMCMLVSAAWPKPAHCTTVPRPPAITVPAAQWQIDSYVCAGLVCTDTKGP